MAALPPDELGGHLFKTCFLHCLPGHLKDLVAVQFHLLGVVELAKYADVIWDAGTPRRQWWRLCSRPLWMRRPPVVRRQLWTEL